MREIIQKEMNAPIPVIVYVFPPKSGPPLPGDHHLAADIAAMAPGTNIGAAHPVGGGGAGGEKGEATP